MLIASLKPRTMGGTTNTGLLTYALHRAGYPVAAYDADESLQLAAWQRKAPDFPCEVVEADHPAFAETVYPGMDHGRVNVVDTGHAENHPDIVDSVLEVADLVILTISPTEPDYNRLTKPERGAPLAKMIKRSGALRDSGRPPVTVALLNRCNASSSKPTEYAELLRNGGTDGALPKWDVLSTRIPLHVGIANAVGSPCDRRDRKAPYDALVTELRDRGLLPGPETFR
ncbi:plasmid partition protein [Streptomyces sp. NPDC092952]|uniref:plasmid partition protein n=1 Tax=Streptomyces sp. NPDC092952 TaxID=3366018 RepID=UPI00382742F4